MNGPNAARNDSNKCIVFRINPKINLVEGFKYFNQSK